MRGPRVVRHSAASPPLALSGAPTNAAPRWPHICNMDMEKSYAYTYLVPLPTNLIYALAAGIPVSASLPSSEGFCYTPVRPRPHARKPRPFDSLTACVRGRVGRLPRGLSAGRCGNK